MTTDLPVVWRHDQPEHAEPGLYVVRLDRREGRARQVAQVLGPYRAARRPEPAPASPSRPSPMTDEVRARIIHERVVQGRTMEAICEDLTRDGVPTAKGGPWRPSTLHTVIKRHRREEG